MKKRTAGKGSRDNVITFCMFAAAALLLSYSVTGTSQAALTYFSENYSARVTVSDIGVTLVENGADISWRNYTGSDDVWHENTGVLLEHMLDGEAVEEGKAPEVKIGKKYQEELCVRNTGSIDQYVRVSVYRYWTDAAGNKRTDLSPALIDLNLTGGDWLLDEDASTEERMVLYYRPILKAGETSALFADSITINNVAAKIVTQTTRTEGGYTTITTTYDYNGVRFTLEAEADAVQTHNAQDAIKSAWGVDVSIDPATGSLSLN